MGLDRNALHGYHVLYLNHTDTLSPNNRRIFYIVQLDISESFRVNSNPLHFLGDLLVLDRSRYNHVQSSSTTLGVYSSWNTRSTSSLDHRRCPPNVRKTRIPFPANFPFRSHRARVLVSTRKSLDMSDGE